MIRKQVLVCNPGLNPNASYDMMETRCKWLRKGAEENA